MRRVCLDVASSYYHPRTRAWLDTPAQARQYFEGQTFRFHAATVFDDLAGQYVDFTRYDELFAYMLDANEIITFNGRVCDLIVLETLVGKEAFAAIWRKPHHDLRGWRGNDALKSAIGNLKPMVLPTFESVKEQRLLDTKISYERDFMASDLAGTYRDVHFTYLLFQEYLASGDTNRTFHEVLD